MMEEEKPRDIAREFAELLEQGRDVGLVRFEDSMRRIEQALQERYIGTTEIADNYAGNLMTKLSSNWIFDGVSAKVSGSIWLQHQDQQDSVPEGFGDPQAEDDDGAWRYDVENATLESRGIDLALEWGADEEITRLRIGYIFVHEDKDKEKKQSEDVVFMAYRDELFEHAYSEVSLEEATRALLEQWPDQFSLINEALDVAPRGLLGQRLQTLVELFHEDLLDDAFSTYFEAYLSSRLVGRSPFLVGMDTQIRLKSDDLSEDGADGFVSIKLNGVLTEPLYGLTAQFKKDSENTKVLRLSGARIDLGGSPVEFVEVDIAHVQLLMSLRGVESLGSRAIQAKYEEGGGDLALLQQASQIFEDSDTTRLLPEGQDELPEHMLTSWNYSEALKEAVRLATQASRLTYVDRQRAEAVATDVCNQINTLLYYASNEKVYVVAKGPHVRVPPVSVKEDVIDDEEDEEKSLRSVTVAYSHKSKWSGLDPEDQWIGLIEGVMSSVHTRQLDSGEIGYHPVIEVRVVRDSQYGRHFSAKHSNGPVDMTLSQLAVVFLDGNTDIKVPVVENYHEKITALQKVDETYHSGVLSTAVRGLHKELLTEDMAQLISLQNPTVFKTIAQQYTEVAVPKDRAQSLIRALEYVLLDRPVIITATQRYTLLNGQLKMVDVRDEREPVGQTTDVRNDLNEERSLMLAVQYVRNGVSVTEYVDIASVTALQF